MHLHYVSRVLRLAHCLQITVGAAVGISPLPPRPNQNGDMAMRSTDLARIESLTWPIMLRGYRQLIGSAASARKAITAMLRAKREERYAMRYEKELRGPLSDEYRRAWWL